jgi:hypothetical protein
MKRTTSWKMSIAALCLLACLMLPSGCSTVPCEPVSTQAGFVVLRPGTTYRTERLLTLPSPEILQAKDDQILDLLKANDRLQRELDLCRGQK